jgi:ABC-2 type transport system permease protein
MIIQSSLTQYDILIINNDMGIEANAQKINYGCNLIDFFKSFDIDSSTIPFKIDEGKDFEVEVERLKNKKVDAVIVLPGSFSSDINNRRLVDSAIAPKVEFYGDLTNINYLISAVWANEILNEFTLMETHSKRSIEIKEIALGTSGKINDFDMIVPGIMTISIIMLMFTASIAFVMEVENRTMLRLKLSKLTAFDFIGGISFVQLLVGIVSILLTLLTAISLGFRYEGSLLIMLLIVGLTSLSIIAFSLIIAAATKSANEVLVVGNFPMFLFMFFTGAAFPLKSASLFTIAGYPISIQGFMTPTHAIAALNKTLVMNMELSSIIPEITAIIALTLIYFLIGALFFKYRHLKLT